MNGFPKFTRKTRWALPGGVLAAVAAVAAGALISSAQASPVLPARTPAQLLAAVGGTKQIPALTGTVVETAKLGLPDLPGLDSPTSLTSLLTGSSTVKIWYADSSHIRLALPGNMSESDVILNGQTAWFWQSTTNSVTRVVLPADHDQQLPMPAAAQTPMALTPQQAASRALAAVGPTTTVSVQSNVVVAGEAAYQLVLAPKSPSSLVGQVRIAIDAAHNVPLRVQVFAKHAASPAFQVGFQSISFVRPAAANFDFTPPPGAKVTTEAVGREGWPTASGHTHPQVIGTGWLSVAVLPSSGLAGLGGGAGSASRAASSAAQSASGTTPSGASPGEETAAIGALLHSATPVHGAWGSGRLLRTSLMSLLITSNGQVLVGAVTPSVLYADAAHVG